MGTKWAHDKTKYAFTISHVRWGKDLFIFDLQIMMKNLKSDYLKQERLKEVRR